MIELPMIFAAGLLGSSHCVGMCGGFAIMLGLRSRNAWHNLGAQSVYSLGRIFTYVVLGCGAGLLGSQMSRDWSNWINVPAALSLVAGLLLVYQGLLATGISLWRKSAAASSGGCLTGSLFKSFFQSPGHLQRFLAGVLTGFLPCGLLYGMLALAAASGNFLTGGLIMLVFGIGTVPLMVATGVGGNLLSLVARTRLLKVAAICVILTGAVTVVRGAGFLMTPASPDAVPQCPFCASAPADSQDEQ